MHIKILRQFGIGAGVSLAMESPDDSASARFDGIDANGIFDIGKVVVYSGTIVVNSSGLYQMRGRPQELHWEQSRELRYGLVQSFLDLAPR